MPQRTAAVSIVSIVVNLPTVSTVRLNDHAPRHLRMPSSGLAPVLAATHSRTPHALALALAARPRRAPVLERSLARPYRRDMTHGAPPPSDTLSEQDFSGFPNKPIAMVTPRMEGEDEGGGGGEENLYVNDDALALLRRIECPVAVLAVCGLYRTGKVCAWRALPPTSRPTFPSFASSSFWPLSARRGATRRNAHAFPLASRPLPA